MHKIDAEASIDFVLADYGSVLLFEPLSEGSRRWLEEHAFGIWFGGALAVEHRFAPSIFQALEGEGFKGEKSEVKGERWERVLKGVHH